ncbi:hypothetical protein CMMCAS04_03410 [Clavibacter michiganensis subsp. michiganensis]|nr:hypothetical protein CMMCAS04_03410 [Clavibacter michiganensis subsp. michiganensis]
MRRLGADVVTGAPADLPPALADRYIRLKATGRLGGGLPAPALTR